MTKEEKDLLTKVLCEQLPYGVFVKENRFSLDDGPVIYTPDYHPYMYDCKPYLRPMYSMTEKENDELYEAGFCDNEGTPYDIPGYIDYLNRHHFDYRSLIPMGLAIAAVGSDNPYNEKGGEE